MNRNGPTLVVAAFEPELTAVRPAIAGRDDVVATPVGIGLVAAALGTAQAIAEHGPARVVLVGTAGLYRDAGDGEGFAIGDVLGAARTALVEGHLDDGKAAGLPGAFDAVELDAELTKQLSGTANPVSVATSLAITVDDETSRARGKRFQLEHLELFGVVTACRRAGVPVGALLGIANLCGRTARTEWRDHHARVEQSVGEALVARLFK